MGSDRITLTPKRLERVLKRSDAEVAEFLREAHI